MTGVSSFMSSSTRRTGSEFTVMLPFASTMWAPNDVNRGPSHMPVSFVAPIGFAKGTPAAWSFRHAARNRSYVHESTRALSRSGLAGNIFWRSMSACFFHRSRREFIG